MKPLLTLKIAIDILMTALLLVLMGYHITENQLHEWLGAAMFVLFLLHHLLNLRWYKNLFRARYTAARVLNTAVNFLLLVTVLLMMVSGIMISRTVFDFLDIGQSMLGRKLHMFSTAWGFLLLSAHLGLHWSMVLGAAKHLPFVGPGGAKRRTIILRVLAGVLSLYGIFAFVSKALYLDMFMLADYPYFDYDQPAILFFTDHIAIMALFACIAYYAVKWKRGPKLAPSANSKTNP